MTTEDGLARVKHARTAIEALRDRLAWLDQQTALWEADHGTPDPNGYRAVEARALRWALPVLEAEWDALARLHRELPEDTTRMADRVAG